MGASPTNALTNAASRLSKSTTAIGGQFLLVCYFQFTDFSQLYNEKKGSVYNVLWVLVFGFATLNILGLVLRRFDPRKTGLNFGEILAITVVFFSIFLLGMEMLNLFHIFPVHLEPH